MDADVDREFATFSRYVIYTPQTDFLRGRQAGKIDTPPIGLHGEGLPDAVESFMKILSRYRQVSVEERAEQILMRSAGDLVLLPGWASTFGTHRGTPSLTSRDVADRSGDIVYFIDRYMHASRNRLSVYDSSEGTLFLLFAAIILTHRDAPKVFALDNVDNALNPALTRLLVEKIIDICNGSETRSPAYGARQVFLTSHNPTALDAFDLFDDNQRVFIVKRNDKGFTVASRLKPPKNMSRVDWEVLHGGRNLSQLWLDGSIPGALGNI